MKHATRKGWGLVALALMGACLGPQPDPWEPFLFPVPHEFSATTASPNLASSGNSLVTFSGPVPVPNRDGTEFFAYALNVSWSRDSGDPGWFVWFVDASMRLVAMDRGCGNVLGGCEQYKEWVWADQGQVSPPGLGWPDLIARNDFTSLANHETAALDHQASFESEGQLKLTVPSVPYDEKSYRYTPGRMLPDDPRWFRVITYQGGEPLGQASTLVPVAFTPGPRPWPGLMFSGEDEEAFGRGVTHREIVEFAFPELGQSADTCVVNYELRPSGAESPNPELPIPDLLQGPRLTAQATVEVVRGAGMAYAGVEVWREDGRTKLKKVSEGTSTGADRTCEEVYRSPWPSLNVTEGLALARSILSHSGDLIDFQHRVGPNQGYYHEYSETSRSWHGWSFSFFPDWFDGSGLYYPYYAAFQPTDPVLFSYWKAHPADTLESLAPT